MKILFLKNDPKQICRVIIPRFHFIFDMSPQKLENCDEKNSPLLEKWMKRLGILLFTIIALQCVNISLTLLRPSGVCSGQTTKESFDGDDEVPLGSLGARKARSVAQENQQSRSSAEPTNAVRS